jgi:hypothetical protein
MTRHATEAQWGLLYVADGLPQPFDVGSLWRGCHEALRLHGDPTPTAASLRVCVNRGWLVEAVLRTAAADGEWMALAGRYWLTESGRDELAAREGRTGA